MCDHQNYSFCPLIDETTNSNVMYNIQVVHKIYSHINFICDGSIESRVIQNKPENILE